jgi:hypothetical protein
MANFQSAVELFIIRAESLPDDRVVDFADDALQVGVAVIEQEVLVDVLSDFEHETKDLWH